MTVSGQQLLGVGWSSVGNSTFVQLLKQMLSIFSHPNQSLSSVTNAFWKDLIRKKEEVSQVFDDSLVRILLSNIPSKLIKLEPEHTFVKYEFDTSDDYEQFYRKSRVEVLEVLRLLTSASEETCFTSCAELLQQQIHKALPQNIASCFNEWEMLTVLLDAVCNKLSLDCLKKFSSHGQSLIESLLSYESKDPDLISLQLSCISALTVFVPYASPTTLNNILLQVSNYFKPMKNVTKFDWIFRSSDFVPILRRKKLNLCGVWKRKIFDDILAHTLLKFARRFRSNFW